MSDEMVDPATGEIVQSQDKFWAAFIKAQAVMEAPKRTQTAKVRTRDGGQGYEFSYAPLDEIVSVARAALGPNGLGFTQEVVHFEGHASIRTRIVHESGQSISSLYPVIADMTRAQGLGSGVTYARRYGLMLALGIVAEEDDDGNAADQNRAEITNRGQQTQQRRPSINPPTQQPSNVRDKAVETRNKVRSAIEQAKTVEQLNKAWTAADETAVKAYVNGGDKIGDRVWATLMEEEADKRLKLTAPADGLDEYLDEEDVGNALR